MGKKRSLDFKRGRKESLTAIGALQVRWPAAFPQDAKMIRPLATVNSDICRELGWSQDYLRGVLAVWKSRWSYSQAVLAHDVRINLDGTESGRVDDEARSQACAMLHATAARREQHQAKENAKATELTAVESTSAAPRGAAAA